MGNILCPWRATITQMGGWALEVAATSYAHNRSGHAGPFVYCWNLIRAPCCAASDEESLWGAVVTVYRICLGAPWGQPKGPDAWRMMYSPHDTTAPLPSPSPAPFMSAIDWALIPPFFWHFLVPCHLAYMAFSLKAKTMEVTHDIHDTFGEIQKSDFRLLNRKSMNLESAKCACEFCPVVYRLCDLGVITYLRLSY